MLTITIPETELFDEGKEEFIHIKEITLNLEHSLISISKWESKWNKAFLGKEEKTNEEILDYIRCMTITQNVSPDTYLGITPEIVKQVSEYIEAPMTATWFSKDAENNKTNSETVTSELIYYWMITLQIPVEFQRWHLNRLLTLIRVCTIKNAPPKKMSKRALMNRNHNLNEQRKLAMHTTG